MALNEQYESRRIHLEIMDSLNEELRRQYPDCLCRYTTQNAGHEGAVSWPLEVNDRCPVHGVE